MAGERRQVRGSTRGSALIVMIVLVPILMGSAAFGVDWTRTQAVSERLQRAVEAAALGAAVYLPDDAQQAEREAQELVWTNMSATDIEVTTTPDAAHPTRVHVSATMPVSYTFASLLGVPDRVIEQFASAEYTAPLVLGSPCNVLGNEDMSADGGGPEQAAVGSAACQDAGKFWASVAGPGMNKSYGDAFATDWCVWDTWQTPTAQCAPEGAGPTPPGHNWEYQPDGYRYVVKVREPGILRVQGFDMPFASVGGRCTGVSNPVNHTELVNPLTGAQHILINEFVDVLPSSTNPRYSDGVGTYCTGDDQQPYPYADNSPEALSMSTQFTLLHPNRAGQPDQPVCPTQSWPGFNALTTRYSEALSFGAGGQQEFSLREGFRRWVDICPGFYAEPGDYVIHVATSPGSGNNRFALRAWQENSSAPVTVVAQEKLQVYSNIAAGRSVFHLVRLGTEMAGRELTMGVFDIGDALQPVTVRVLGVDSQASLGPCQLDGAVTGQRSECAFDASYAVTNGQWVTMTYQVPRTYRCSDDRDMTQCWVRVEISSPEQMFDAMTWVARTPGGPVRLISAG